MGIEELTLAHADERDLSKLKEYQAVVVVVDEVYREPVRTEDVPAIVEELRRAD